MYLKKLSTKFIFRDQLWSTWDGDYMIPGFEIETSDHPFGTYYTLRLYGTFTSLLSEVTATAPYEKSTNLKLNNFKLHWDIFKMLSTNLIFDKAVQCSTWYLCKFFWHQKWVFSLYGEFLDNMVEKKLPLVTFMIYNLNHFSGLIVNLFYLPKFLFRARIFRRNFSIISLTKTRTSKKERNV